MATMVQLSRKPLFLILLTLLALRALPAEVELRYLVPEDFPALERMQEEARKELDLITAGDGSAADLADARYAMETWLRQAGYAEGVIRFRMLETTAAGEMEIERADRWSRVEIIEFEVRPGEKFYLGSLEFDGELSFEESRLREFFPDFTDLPYNRRQIEEAVARVARFYTINGYMDAEVGPAVKTRRQDSPSYDLRIPVDEGPQYRIEEIEVQSDTLASKRRGELEEATSIVGQPYFPRLAAEGALRIEREMGRAGFAAEVEYKTQRIAPGKMGIVYTVTPGPRLFVTAVEIRHRGDEPLRTREALVRDLFERDFPPGERTPIDFDALNRLEGELYGLGLFSLVDITIEERQGEEASSLPEPSQTVNIVVELEELKSQYLEVEASWNSYERIRGEIGFNDRNLFGLARRFSLSGYGSLKSYVLQGSLTDPLILGSGSTISLNGDISYRDGEAFERRQYGGELSVVHRIDSATAVTAAYQYRRSITGRVSGEIAGSEISDFSSGRLRLSLEYDTRDSPLSPFEGEAFTVAPFVAPRFLGSDIGFYGGVVDLEGHRSFWRRLTLSAAGRYRLRARTDAETGIPIQERLFLGGAYSVRSFDQDQLGLINAQGVSQGGLSSLEAGVEVRTRMVSELYTSLFYDAGFISPRSFSLEGDIGYAVGAGLRYYLPVGPLRFDVAYNPGPTYGSSSRWHFHFAVGLSY